jgi:hypothetical protein
MRDSLGDTLDEVFGTWVSGLQSLPEFVVSHPNDKNKDVVRVGHPWSCPSTAAKKAKARATADPSTSLRFAQDDKLLEWEQISQA